MQPVAAQNRSPAVADALALVHCIEEMGSRRSNPVLDVLGCERRVVRGEHYPAAGALTFAGQPWRAYYHAHGGDGAGCGHEHGHFHVFAGGADHVGASHVAALALDQDGQPVRWFAVNRWVTGGVWRPAAELNVYMEAIAANAAMSTAERWLAAMVRIYRSELTDMLDECDRRLEQLRMECHDCDVHEDRGVYTLAERPVRLLERLQSLLYPDPASAAKAADGLDMDLDKICDD